VWYELGFAFARKKDVVLVCCSDERVKDDYPFDIRHRDIINYKASSSSDFELLNTKITERIKAFIKSSNTEKSLNTTSVNLNGLKQHELAFLSLVAENTITEGDVALFEIKNRMNNSGFTDIAVKVSSSSLCRLELIEIASRYLDSYGDECVIFCKLTEKGVEWILNNHDKFQFKRDIDSLDSLFGKKAVVENDVKGEDLPF
jgi:hypothetical protein